MGRAGRSLAAIAVVLVGLGGPSQLLRAAEGDYAWNGAVGWIQFGFSAAAGETPQSVLGRAYLSGYAWNGRAGWIDLGDGSPTNGYAYGNVDGSDFGVNHDGVGNLSGLAWSENAGWLNFGWASSDHEDRPRVDLATGAFSGFAWSEGMGWIHLGALPLATTRLEITDVDADGIDDPFEWRNFGDLTTAGVGTDYDADSSPDLAESVADTDPKDPLSYLRILSADYNADLSEAVLEFTSHPSVLYRIQTSTTLAGESSWTTVTPPGSFLPDPGDRTTRTLTVPPQPKRFFRIHAQVPLQQ